MVKRVAAIGDENPTVFSPSARRDRVLTKAPVSRPHCSTTLTGIRLPLSWIQSKPGLSNLTVIRQLKPLLGLEASLQQLDRAPAEHPVEKSAENKMISGEEVEVEKRARQIFLACARAYSKQGDLEGVITVSDLPDLLRQVDPALLSMDEKQQQELFRRLDANQDGAITLAELTSALSSFCTAHPETEEQPATNTSVGEDDVHAADAAAAEETPFADRLRSRSRIMSMVLNARLSQEMTFVSTVEEQAPQLIDDVAKLMVAIEQAIQMREAEVQALQLQIEAQKASQERQIHDLYEEMESKIKQECDLVAAEVQQKGRSKIESLRGRIEEKEKQLSELESKQAAVLDEVAKLNTRLTETRDAISELTGSKEALEESLLKAELNLEEKTSDMATLQKTLEEERRKRLTKSSGLHNELEEEYEQLLTQITTLRMANRKLMDERDERYCQRQPSLGSINEDATVAFYHQFQAEPSFDEVSLSGGSGSCISLSAIHLQAQAIERRGEDMVKDAPAQQSKPKGAENPLRAVYAPQRIGSLPEQVQSAGALAMLRKLSMDQRRMMSPSLSVTSITSYGATIEQPAPILTTGASVIFTAVLRATDQDFVVRVAYLDFTQRSDGPARVFIVHLATSS
nr:unnamed protein product [Spirometra erinaceieuropaei]